MRKRYTRVALVSGVQTLSLPIFTEITLESRRVAVTMISSMDEAHPAIQAESCAMEGVAAKIFASEANAMPVARGALPIPFLRPMIILLVFWRCHDRQRGNARAKILPAG